MRSCYFCGESNALVLELAHITPRCIGDKVFDKSDGTVDVEVTVDLCANCHKKFERLQTPYVTFVKTASNADEEKQIDLSKADVFQAVIVAVSAKNNRPSAMLETKEWYGMSTDIRLHRSIIGKAFVAWSNNDFVDLYVVDGVVVNIVKSKKIKPPKNQQVEMRKSLRDKLSIILGVLSDLEKEKGMVNRQELLDILKNCHGFEYSESNLFINGMLKEGTLFSHGKNFIKKS